MEEEEVACLLISSNCRLFRYLFPVAFDIFEYPTDKQMGRKSVGPKGHKDIGKGGIDTDIQLLYTIGNI